MARPETDYTRRNAINVLGNGLYEANHYEDALSVKEAELSTERRLGAPEQAILVTQSNLAPTYLALGRLEEALRMQRDVYSGYLKHYGNEHRETCLIAENYALTLMDLGRFKEAKRVLRGPGGR